MSGVVGATAGESPTAVAHYLGIAPSWVDGTAVGGCSFMLHVRHAAAAIEAGLCQCVLITHGESGRSNVGRAGWASSPGSLAGQFEAPFGRRWIGPTAKHMHLWGRVLALVGSARD